MARRGGSNQVAAAAQGSSLSLSPPAVVMRVLDTGPVLMSLIGLGLTLLISFSLTCAYAATREFQPQFWPVNPIYFLCVAAPVTVHAYIKEQDLLQEHADSTDKTDGLPKPYPPNMFFAPSLILNAVALAISAVSLREFLNGTGAFHPELFYQGVTYPFSSVTQVGLMSFTPGNTMDARFASVIIVVITTSITLLFQLILVTEHADRNYSADFSYVRTIANEWSCSHTLFFVFYVLAAMVVVLELINSLLPYARWQITDTPHACVIAGIVAASTPNFYDPSQHSFYWVTVLILLLGMVQSSIYLAQTMAHLYDRCDSSDACFLNAANYQTHILNYTLPFAQYVLPVSQSSADTASAAFAASSFIHHFCSVLLLALGSIIFTIKLLDVYGKNLVLRPEAYESLDGRGDEEEETNENQNIPEIEPLGRLVTPRFAPPIRTQTYVPSQYLQ